MNFRIIPRRQFLTLMVGSALLPSACTSTNQSTASAVPPAANFTVYDSLLYPQKPSAGLKPIIVSGNSFWKDKDRTVPYESACRQAAREAAEKVSKFVIDIEHWPINYQKTSKAEVQETMQKVIQIIAWMKSEAPKLGIGVYAFPPIRDYWTPVRQLPGSMSSWREQNEFLRPVAEKADFLAPSLYTFYDDIPGWIKYANASIVEAQRFGKPVYPFLWTRYHVSNKKLKFSFIPGDFWRTQLQTIRASGAQGVVLWDWYADSHPATGVLDTSQDWWKETVSFLKRS